MDAVAKSNRRETVRRSWPKVWPVPWPVSMTTRAAAIAARTMSMCAQFMLDSWFSREKASRKRREQDRDSNYGL
jgi:hypothetical protein